MFAVPSFVPGVEFRWRWRRCADVVDHERTESIDPFVVSIRSGHVLRSFCSSTNMSGNVSSTLILILILN